MVFQESRGWAVWEGGLGRGRGKYSVDYSPPECPTSVRHSMSQPALSVNTGNIVLPENGSSVSTGEVFSRLIKYATVQCLYF